jgi:hypothetical protein
MKAKTPKPAKGKKKATPAVAPQAREPAKAAKMNIVSKFHTLVKNPDKFFSAVAGEKGVFPAFCYYALIGLIGIFILAPKTLMDPAMSEIAALIGPMLLPIIYVASLGFIFIAVGIEHVFVRLLGGKAGYAQTFKAAAYGGATAGLIGAVPAALIALPAATGMVLPPVADALLLLSGIVSMAFSIWGIYLVSKGISKLHDMSFAKAVVATFLLPLAVILIAILVAGVAGIMLMSAYDPAALGIAP